MALINRNKRVVMYYEKGQYFLEPARNWHEDSEKYRRSPIALQSVKEFDLDLGWLNILYPVQWTLGVQEALKEIYEEYADGNQNGNG